MNSMKNRYKLMTNPNSRCRSSCAAYGCDMRSGTNALSEIKMFHFPRNPYRRRRWELATRRDNWKATTRARLCSKHFITGKPSKDPEHPDHVPSIFVFTENAQSLKRSARKKICDRIKSTVDKSCENVASNSNISSNEGTSITPSCGIKTSCGSCFSTESVSSAFDRSLAPLNQSLSRVMDKLKDMEEERKQLCNELSICQEEIHLLRETHQHCIVQSQSTSMQTKPCSTVSDPSTTSDSVTETLEIYPDVPADIDDPDLLPSLLLEKRHRQSDTSSKGKRLKKRSNKMHSGEMISIMKQCPTPKLKKRSNKMHSDEMISIMKQCPTPKKKKMKDTNLESENTKESPKGGKGSGSPITIVYLKR